MTTPDTPPIPNWPTSPAVYGWLSLDRRGGWRLQGEPVTHAGLVRYLNEHYGADAGGNWFVRNGAQRVFAALDYAPLVLRLEPDGRLVAHTGADAGAVRSVHLDEDGNVLLATGCGPGLLDDRDLAAFLGQCQGRDGAPAQDDAIVAVLGGGNGVFWQGLPLQPIRRADVPKRFGFRPVPTDRRS